MSNFHSTRRRLWALSLIPALALTMLLVPDYAPAAKTASLSAGKQKVQTGKRVALEGQFAVAQRTDGTSGGDLHRGKVRIELQRPGSPKWKAVAKTRLRKDGSYREKVKVRVTGRYRAVGPTGAITPPQRIRAKSKLKLRVRGSDATAGERVRVRGQVVPRAAKRKVAVRIGGERLQARTKANGRFKVRWRASGTGSHRVSGKAKGDRLAAGSRDRAGKVTVYRPAQASWYGPGFYGNRTACGQTLTTGTVGVAHKTMPCGTKLKLRYKGKTVPVRVIDRGPYHGNREFDLTYATKRKLGFGQLGVVHSSK